MLKSVKLVPVVAAFLASSFIIGAQGCSAPAPDESSAETSEALSSDGSAGVVAAHSETADASSVDTGADEASVSIDGGDCLTVDLVALRSYVTGESTDAVATLPHPMKFAVPQSVPVTTGNAGNYLLMLEWRDGDAGLVTCTYRGGASKGHPTLAADVAKGRSYVFVSCDNHAHALDIAEATTLTLHIEGGDYRDKSEETAAHLVVNESTCASDAGSDAAIDAGSDAARDGGGDAGDGGDSGKPDAALEAGIDAAPEASTPEASAPEAGPTCTTSSCNDNNPCTTDTCRSDGTCANTALTAGSACGDNSNKCLGAFTCSASAQCVQGAPPTIDTSNPCTSGRCDPATGVVYSSVAAGTACGDNSNKCVGARACDGAGSCVQGPAPVIDTSNACRSGRCDPATGVVYTSVAAGVACGDNTNKCAGARACDGAGACVQGAPPAIDTSNPCLVGRCDPASGVSYAPAASGTACGTNVNRCSGTLACNATGQCIAGPPPVIDTSNPCMVGRCDPVLGVTYTPAATGTACGDNSNKCVGASACSAAGQCAQGPAPAPNPPSACFTTTCVPATGFVYTPIAGCQLPPPDPSTIAPPIDSTVPTDIATANAYLYTGSNAIQTGVAPGIIDPKRIVVLRGSVVARDGTPVVTAVVTILGHPEWGQTLTRADGAFTMVANGGGSLVVQMAKQGFLTIQRKVDSAWREHVTAPQVVMVPYDAQVTELALTGTTSVQAARGSTVVDADGTRTATVIIPSRTQALLRMSDGTTQPIASAHFRATEMTVGPSGPRAMIASLPPKSAYTYAVSLDFDEATATNADGVEFSAPLPFYVDNFLGFAVGGVVPTGFYDRKLGRWVPSADGRVIKVLSVAAGTVTVDTDGDGIADDEPKLALLGITSEERTQLATLYVAGATLWRVPISHFTTYDCNWASRMPPDAAWPPSLGSSGGPVRRAGDKPRKNPDCEDEEKGSIIGCDRLSLDEELPIAGTTANLRYSSERVGGYRRTLAIAVTGPTVPVSLKRVEVDVEVSGRTIHVGPFPPIANQGTTFVWDGKDAEGRSLQGEYPARVKVGYVYSVTYVAPSGGGSAFGQWSNTGAPMTQNFTDREITLWDYRSETLVGSGLGHDVLGARGWSVSAHHVYDPNTGTLYRGDGSWTAGSSYSQVVAKPDAVHAASGFPGVFTIDASGNFLYLQNNSPGLQVVRVTDAGVSSVLYQSARGMAPGSVTAGPDGSIYFQSYGGYTLVRVSPTGQATTIAGTGTRGMGGVGGPATSAQIGDVSGVTVDRDGNVYFIDAIDFGSSAESPARICQIGPDGNLIVLLTYSSFPSGVIPDDGNPTSASRAYLTGRAWGLTADAGGTLYFFDNQRLRKISPDGQVVTAAIVMDNAPVRAAPSTIVAPKSLAPAPGGGVYVCDTTRLLEVKPGVIRTVLGDDTVDVATTPAICGYSLSSAPNGNVYSVPIAGPNASLLMAFASSLPGYSLSDIVVPDDQGRTYHVFSNAGKHLRTVETETGLTLLAFRYAANGRLATITDLDGDVITVESDASAATAIVGPFGHRTGLTVQGGLLTNAVDPTGAATKFTYGAGDLLASLTDANNNLHTFSYDAKGLLARDTNPSGLVKTASQTENSVSRVSTITTTLGRTSTYRVDVVDDSHMRRSKTSPAGITVASVVSDGTINTAYADGTTEVRTFSADPLFGGVVRVGAASSTRLPSGLTMSSQESRSVSTAANDPLRVAAETATLTVNGRAFTNTFTASTASETFVMPSGRSLTTQYDAKGRVVGIGMPGLAPLSMSRDTHGRLIGATIGARTVGLGYGAGGALSTFTDASAQTTSFDVDANNRLRQWTLPDSSSVQLARDSNGNIRSLQPPGRTAHAFSYGAGDLLGAYAPPPVAGGGTVTTSYAYNQDAQLSALIRPDAITVTPSYDAAGRLASVTDGSEVRTFGYDATSGKLSNARTASGQVVSLTRDGFLITDVTWSGQVVGAVHWNYDTDFRVVSEQVQGTPPITYAYDVDGLVVAAGAETLTNDPANGGVNGTSLGSLTDTYAYSTYGEVAAFQANYSSTSLMTVAYTRDNAGRIATKRETIGGETHTTAYQYDVRGRLAQVTIDAGAIETYQFDANGNRIQTTANGVPTTADVDAQDRLTRTGNATFAYNANGDLVQRADSTGTTTYAYDGFGALRAVVLPGGARVDYVVDGLGRRVSKSVNGTRIASWLYQNAVNPISELDASGNVAARFVYGRTPMVPDYMVRGGATYRFITDENASVRLVVDVATGVVAQRMDYDPWGKVTRDSNPGFQPFGFAGGLYDSDTKLVRFGARDYAPDLGRWMRKDPLGFGGADTNLYAYAGSDPVNNVDPSGLLWRQAIRLGQTALKYGERLLQRKEALRLRKAGKDVVTNSRRAGKKLEKDVSRERGGSGKAICEDAHKPGQLDHAHAESAGGDRFEGHTFIDPDLKALAPWWMDIFDHNDNGEFDGQDVMDIVNPTPVPFYLIEQWMNAGAAPGGHVA